MVTRMVNTTAKNKERKIICPTLHWNPSIHGNIWIRSFRWIKQRQVSIRKGVDDHTVGDYAAKGRDLLPARAVLQEIVEGQCGQSESCTVKTKRFSSTPAHA